MANAHSRERLIELIDRKVFDPILRTSPEGYDENQRSRLEHVKRNTESEKKRFHDDYRTAEEVRDNYLSDLNSRTAERVDRDLNELGLPKLPDIREEFDRLCQELGLR